MALCWRLGERMRVLPRGRPMMDPDRTVLWHQHESSGSVHPAEIVLTGDSACLTGVDASRLGDSMGGQPEAWNLGLIIGLDLEIYGDAVRRFLNRNPDQARLVVLLVTPQRLKDEDLSPHHAKIWREMSNHSGSQTGSRLFAAPAEGEGFADLRKRVASCFLDRPLPGAGGAYYGFPQGVLLYLRQHNGTLVDVGRYRASPGVNPPRYRLSPSLEAPSRGFRALIPRSIPLATGLMPVPESSASADFDKHHDALLRGWNRWLESDVLLTNLPARMPDALFASGAHLNARGQATFTRLLGVELDRFLLE
jgi:hypothetical protein